MPGTPRHARFGRASYGGPPRKKMLTTSTGNVIYASAWANPPSKHECLTNQSSHWNLSRSEGWISSTLSNQLWLGPGTNISSWQQTIVQNGQRPRHFAITQPCPRPNSFTNTYGVVLDVQQSSSATKAVIFSIALVENSPHIMRQYIRKAHRTTLR